MTNINKTFGGKNPKELKCLFIVLESGKEICKNIFGKTCLSFSS